MSLFVVVCHITQCRDLELPAGIGSGWRIPPNHACSLFGEMSPIRTLQTVLTGATALDNASVLLPADKTARVGGQRAVTACARPALPGEEAGDGERETEEVC